MINRNVISGLLLFSVSILLGPYMMEILSKDSLGPAIMEEFTAARELNGALTAHEEIAEEGAADSADRVAVAAGKTVVASLKAKQTEWSYENIKFSHAHGNLEGILNILAGLVLAQLAIAARFRDVISWLLVVGSWGHAGVFIVGNLWFSQILSYGRYGGALLILGLWGLLVAVIMHARQKRAA